MEIPHGPVEITPHTDKPSRLTQSQKEAILSTLETERNLRRQQIVSSSHSQFKHDLPFAVSPQPSSLHENRAPSPSVARPSHRYEFMHNQLKDPEFERLSSIYENYLKSPTVPESRLTRAPARSRSLSRPSSAPPSRRKSTDQLIKEKEEKLRAQCTFQPKITQLPRSRNLNYNLTERPLSQQAKLAVLAQPQVSKIQQRERLKREQEEQRNSQFTFRPQVNCYNRSLNSSRSMSELPVEERLYNDGAAKNKERQRLQRAMQEASASHYPFHPQVQSGVNKLVGAQREKPPIYQRLQEMQREKQMAMERLRRESEDKQSTFKPQINEQSEKLALVRKIKTESTGLSVCQKLNREALYRAERRVQPEEDPAPLLSVDSSKLSSNFLTRQQLMQEKLQAKREKLASQQHSYSFKPQIDQNSRYLTVADKSRSSESLHQKYERWSHKESQKRVSKQTQLQEEHYSQYVFKPSINSLSKQLGREVSVQEMANTESIDKKRREFAEKQIEERERECSFAPTTISNKKYAEMQSKYGQNRDISRNIGEGARAKEEKLGKLKKQQEFDEMRNCTFQPENLELGLNTEPKGEVKGLGRYLELKEMARRQQTEQKLREDRAFKVNARWTAGQPTVPQPFNLRPSQKEEKMARIKEVLCAEEQRRCTFTPKIERQFIYNMLEYQQPEEDYLLNYA